MSIFPISTSNGESRQLALAASRRSFVALCLVALSFSYEIPLANITPWYRANPRLFDVSLVVFIFVRSLEWNINATLQPPRSPIILPWALCAFGMILGHVSGLLWISSDSVALSLFYAAKYAISLFFLWQALSIPMSENRLRIILRIIAFGASISSMVSVFQFLKILEPFQRMTTEGEFTSREGFISGTVEVGYFNSACYGALGFAVSMSLFRSARGLWRGFAVVTGVLSALGALVSGSRTGVFLVGFFIAFRVLVAAIVFFRTSAAVALRTGITICLATIVVWLAGAEIVQDSHVFLRLQKTVEATKSQDESEGIDLVSRMTTPFEHMGDMLAEHPWRSILFSVGYGDLLETGKYSNWQHVHNIYLWPLQYGGIIAFCAFFWLCTRLHYRFYRNARLWPATLGGMFSGEILAFFWAWGIVGLSGQVFWFYEGLNNFNNLLLLVYGLASCPMGFERGLDSQQSQVQ